MKSPEAKALDLFNSLRENRDRLQEGEDGQVRGLYLNHAVFDSVPGPADYPITQEWTGMVRTPLHGILSLVRVETFFPEIKSINHVLTMPADRSGEGARIAGRLPLWPSEEEPLTQAAGGGYDGAVHFWYGLRHNVLYVGQQGFFPGGNTTELVIPTFSSRIEGTAHQDIWLPSAAHVAAALGIQATGLPDAGSAAA